MKETALFKIKKNAHISKIFPTFFKLIQPYYNYYNCIIQKR